MLVIDGNQRGVFFSSLFDFMDLKFAIAFHEPNKNYWKICQKVDLPRSTGTKRVHDQGDGTGNLRALV